MIRLTRTGSDALHRGAAALEAAMLADIRRLYLAAQQSPVDGLAGASLVHWVFRI